MTVKIVATAYSDICDGFMYGKRFLKLPSQIIEALDNYFDGSEINITGEGAANPDNVWLNHYVCGDHEEVLVYRTHFLTKDEYLALKESGSLEDYIDSRYSDIISRLSESVHFLGKVYGKWHYLV